MCRPSVLWHLLFHPACVRYQTCPGRCTECTLIITKSLSLLREVAHLGKPHVRFMLLKIVDLTFELNQTHFIMPCYYAMLFCHVVLDCSFEVSANWSGLKSNVMYHVASPLAFRIVEPLKNINGVCTARSRCTTVGLLEASLIHCNHLIIKAICDNEVKTCCSRCLCVHSRVYVFLVGWKAVLRHKFARGMYHSQH